jgi:hypothetical protein
VVRGASGDECEELIGGKGTIGLQAAVPKRPHTRPLTIVWSVLPFMCNNEALNLSTFCRVISHVGRLVRTI